MRSRLKGFAALKQMVGTRFPPTSRLSPDPRLFNEAIGLPILPATEQPHELLPYQIDIDQYMGRDIVVNKSNKIGITEGFLRKILRMIFAPRSPDENLRGFDIILTSSEETLANENMRRFQAILAKSAILFPTVKRMIPTRTEFWDGTRVLAIPANPAALRSWPRVKCVFDDEAAHKLRLDDREFLAASSSRLANTNGFLYVVSTPHGQRGYFYTIYTEAKAGRNKFKEFTLPYYVGLGTFFTEEYIAKERSHLGALFGQEYECKFLTAENAAIDEAILNRASEDYEVENL